MDNFFQIIFILFLIISFVAPLFKKKPEQQNGKAQKPKDSVNNRTGSESNRSKAENDILKEIESIFKTSEEIKKPVEDIEDKQTYQDSPYETPEWEKALKTEHTINDEWHRPTTEADFEKESTLITEEANRIQKLIDARNRPVNIRLGVLRKSLKNPETLKEYILMSEILGKPRAFHRHVR
ncbi:MAG TPA: hypothetical protein VKA26_15385 [Ignavibacteriaceae bacterium]|nr:hypothetical protein [Ignavibacteriaceae bacterium]